MPSCFLCSTDLAPVIADGTYWRLILNINQNLLGKSMWVLRRHLEAVPDLSPAEWMELHSLLSRTRQTLGDAFQPDHYNYAFMQNQDRHVHMHVIPRYANPRLVDGFEFTDPDWPGHYTALNPSRRLAPRSLTHVTESLREIWKRHET